MAPERRVPILRQDFSVLDSEFNSIRERFEQEMRKMEDEMTKFRSDLMAKEQEQISRLTSSSERITRITSGTGSTTHKSEFKTWIDGAPQEQQQQQQTTTTSSTTPNGACAADFTTNTTTSATNQGTHRSEVRTWLDGLSSPLIQDGAEGKQIKLRFDVSQYTPEEIVVKTVDNKLQVHAKHEEKSENRSVYREYNREFLLPKDTNPEEIKSHLSKDGVLTVEAPLPAIEGSRERLIPIQQ